MDAFYRCLFDDLFPPIQTCEEQNHQHVEKTVEVQMEKASVEELTEFSFWLEIRAEELSRKLVKFFGGEETSQELRSLPKSAESENDCYH